MPKPGKFAFFIFAVGLLGISVPLQAQWSFNPNLVSNVMSPINLNPCTGGACTGESNKSASSGSNRSAEAATRGSVSDLTFQSSKDRRKANLAQFIEKTRKVDPSGADDMAKIFASTDVIGEIGQGIAPYGLRTDNVADAYTVYWMTAWQAANGDTSDFTRSQSQAVKQQSADALLRTSEFINASDSVKQEMAEAYLVQAALIQATADVAQTDRKLKAGLPNAVRKGAKASGLDLDMMVLTADGFKMRKGSDASDIVPPVPGEQLPTLATTAGQTGSDNINASDNTSTYALIAAVGGVGLAAAFGFGRLFR